MEIALHNFYGHYLNACFFPYGTDMRLQAVKNHSINELHGYCDSPNVFLL